VLLHNFLPAAALRYEVDWEAVRAVNPMAVHCTIAGYPSDGPDASGPGTTS
jgi:Predicted acyl-CoA transferases/carnitine dehydratase